MIDFKPQLIEALEEATGLKVYFELFCDDRTATPCITYTEYNSYSMYEGDTKRFSKVQYMIKVWGTDIDGLMETALIIDDTMLSLGFTRVSSGELVVDNQICKMMVFEGTGYEIK